MRICEVTTDQFLNNFAEELKNSLGLRSLNLYMVNSNTVKISMIAVPMNKLKQGIGTKAMKEIVKFADENKFKIVLTTGQKDDSFGTTSSTRLKSFYKRFGFVENKGRNKDFSLSGNMYRNPR